MVLCATAAMAIYHVSIGEREDLCGPADMVRIG
jgi:hypothetical protein